MAATAGVGILVGGIVFNLVGNSLSSKVDEAERQMKEAEGQISKICKYLGTLKTIATSYRKSLSTVYAIYQKHLSLISRIVINEGRSDWNEFTSEERLHMENLVLLVGVLYRMCKTNLVVESDKDDGINEVNYDEALKQIKDSDALLKERGLSAVPA